MLTRRILWTLSAGVVLTASWASAYTVELVEKYSDLESPMRVVVGVPAGEEKMLAHRREKIKGMVRDHVSARKANSTAPSSSSSDSDDIEADYEPLFDTIQYTFIESDAGLEFERLFPKHVGNDALPLPALRLQNTDTGDFMAPDWQILLKDFPSELERLVGDFEHWMGQTDEIEKDEDGILTLHGKNIKTAAFQHEVILGVFYAPWCQFSQALLPKITAFAKLLKELTAKKVLPPGIGIGKINVDREGDLRQKYEISVYPTMLVLNDKTEEDGTQGLPSSRRILGHPDTVGDILAHVSAVAQPLHNIDDKAAQRQFQALLDAVKGQPRSEGTGLTVVIAVDSSVLTLKRLEELAPSLVGQGTFLARTPDKTLATSLLQKILGKDFKNSVKSSGVTIKDKTLLVVNLVPREAATPKISALADFGSSDDATLTRWVSAAMWPAISRFDPGSTQGDRMRDGPVRTVMMMVGDEDDFLFEDYKKTLEEVAKAHLGQSNFLYGDKDEPRVAPFIRMGSLTTFPAVVLVSMDGAFPPQTVEGGAQVTVESLTAMLDNADTLTKENLKTDKDEL